MATEKDWRRKILVGGLVLMVPIVGWYALLGYRKTVVHRLVSGTEPMLPDWRGRFWRFVIEGWKAAFVIYVHFSPVILWFIIRVSRSQAASELPWTWILLFLLAYPIFMPVAIPALSFYLVWLTPVPFVSTWEAFLMMTVYGGITFVIPAGFLRVSKYETIFAAFHLIENLRFIQRHLVRYCEAWLGSGIVSLIGHFALPVSPWGVMWCYLAIVYAFNEVPATDDQYQSHPEYLRDSWVVQADQLLDRYRVERGGWLNRYQPALEAGESTQPAMGTGENKQPADRTPPSRRQLAAEPFASLSIFGVEVPLG